MERFKRPRSEDIVAIAVLFNNGVIDKHVTNMVGMAEFIIDRLYENGDILKKCSREDDHDPSRWDVLSKMVWDKELEQILGKKTE